jgi:hypothetical protein
MLCWNWNCHFSLVSSHRVLYVYSPEDCLLFVVSRDCGYEMIPHSVCGCLNLTAKKGVISNNGKVLV